VRIYSGPVRFLWRTKELKICGGEMFLVQVIKAYDATSSCNRNPKRNTTRRNRMLPTLEPTHTYITYIATGERVPGIVVTGRVATDVV
jgi:hypothetical protein